jgi:hypothetical protein
VNNDCHDQFLAFAGQPRLTIALALAWADDFASLGRWPNSRNSDTPGAPAQREDVRLPGIELDPRP